MSAPALPSLGNTDRIRLLARFREANQANEALLELANQIAGEHDEALQRCRAELTRISEMCAPLVGDANSAEDAVRSLVAVVEKLRGERDLFMQAHDDICGEAARLQALLDEKPKTTTRRRKK